MFASRFTLAAIATLVALALQAGEFRPLSAEDRQPQLPNDCWSGEIVVAESGGEFDCMPLRDALHMSGCDDGDFLTYDASGGIDCTSPSQFSSGARDLLPQCSSGQILVSEGYSGWRCADPPPRP
jgi:hypothetical protein